ncbi:MAG: alpha-glucan family phosphorylase [Candidatus Woesearchaeota archaeon]
MLNIRDLKEHPPEKDHIAYFTMEVGISHMIPTYSGGLGILAGDILKSYADINLPVIGITLLNSKGYFYQKFDENHNQIEDPVNWNIEESMELLPNKVVVNIEGRDVYVKAWKHMIRGQLGHNIPVIFLDTDCEENSEWDKNITSHLYGGDRWYRLCQEIVLGVGGVRMLESLNYNKIKKYHMNEGHAALLTVELLNKSSVNENIDIIPVKDKCVFTTHTPVAAGHDKFDVDLFLKATGNLVPIEIMEKIVQDGKVNMTLLALIMSTYVNGVAKRHGEVSREMFPEYQIDSITNGVHLPSWISMQMKSVFDKHIPGWSIDPYTLRSALSIPKEDIDHAHHEAKNILIDYINQEKNIGFHPDRFTIGFARRFTAYKRPDLILHDIERLKKVAEKVGDIQVVFAGKAHPSDTVGKQIINKIINTCNQINDENGKLKMVFLENYNMLLSRKMVSGSDVWLNTPQRPYEASGTSGMKAALNGVPQISTIDGWWVEGLVENVTGWGLGKAPQDPGFNEDFDPTEEAEDLYYKLENVIVPMYYANKDKWLDIRRHAIAMNASFFNTYRMAQQYVANAYLD